MFETYTQLRDFLDRYTSKDGTIQGDPASIAAEAVGAGHVVADDNYRAQFEEIDPDPFIVYVDPA